MVLIFMKASEYIGLRVWCLGFRVSLRRSSSGQISGGTVIEGLHRSHMSPLTLYEHDVMSLTCGYHRPAIPPRTFPD